jgi:acetyl-CoA acyltransferase 1
MNRLSLIQEQITNNNFNNDIISSKNDDNIPYIIDGIRTPITKAFKGGLSKFGPEILLSELFTKIIERNSFLSENPKLIDEIIIGNALQDIGGFVNSRAAEYISGIPKTVPLYTVNRLCNSGLQAIINANNSIISGDGNIYIAGGVESMSFNSFKKMLDKKLLSDEIINLENEQIKNILTPMGITNENICKKYNISRKEQDLFSYNSHIKASRAKSKLKNEIISIKNYDKDDCIRENISLESLSKLKPCFVKNGSVTAGNSSPLSDGAALCLLVSKSIIKKYNIKKDRILGRITGYVSVGVPPEIMGIGPSVAIPLLIKKEGLKIDDIDLFEINEAFAGQAIYCIKKLKIPENKVNIHGGAIAIGYPLGCSGARLVIAMLNQLKLYNKKKGIVSMCVGTGMGCAALIERDTPNI